METLPAVKSHMPVMSVSDAIERRQAIDEFRRDILVSGTDYGVIPGTGTKPTLFKPGAEKLCTFFGLAPKFVATEKILDWTGKDHDGEPFFFFQYTCELWHKGEFVGEGGGNCSSWERKYRYKRNAKNPDIADIVNTLDKMAQKRALMAAVLVVTNASQYFTQDLEDMDNIPRDVTPRYPHPDKMARNKAIKDAAVAMPEPEDVPSWPTREEYSPPEGLKLETLQDIVDVISVSLAQQGVIPEDIPDLIQRTLGEVTMNHKQVAIDIAPWSRLSALWYNKYAAILRERAGISQDEYRAYMAKNFPEVEGPGKLSKKQQQQTINWLSVVVEEPRDITYSEVVSDVVKITGVKDAEAQDWLMSTFSMGADSDMSLLTMVRETLTSSDGDEIRSDIRSYLANGPLGKSTEA